MKKQLHILSLDDAFESLDDLWLYNLNKYFETNDANWFIDGYTGKEKKIDRMQLEAIELKLTEDYYEKTGDRSMELRLNIVARIDQLQTKYTVCKALLDVMWKGFGNSEEEMTMRYRYIQELGKWGYKIPIIALPEEEKEILLQIDQLLDGIETEIHIQHEKLKKKRKGDAISFERMLIITEKGLGLQRRIDPKQTTTSEWIGMQEQLSKIAQKN